jgi:hypothetical protein
MWSKGWPAMVTPRLPMRVKSEAASRPGSCTWAKNTSLGGPDSARQRRTFRCRLRNCLSANWPGWRRCSSAKIVLACKPGWSSSSAHTSSQTPANGSTRVRQSCGRASALGNLPSRRYFRAVFSSMSVLTAAAVSVLLPASNCNSFRTCRSVTIASLHA